MHFIVFEGTTEEHTHPSDGLGLCGDADLKAVSPGDVVWIITRIVGDRPNPGLCGRLVAAEVRPHSASSINYDRAHADCSHHLKVDERSSKRCRPIPCGMIPSWDIWRQPFRGVRMLTEEQGDALECEWAGSVHRARSDT